MYTMQHVWETLRLIISLGVIISCTSAAKQMHSPAFVFRADSILVKETPTQIEANGDVILSHKGMLVRADKVIYEKEYDKVTATGNVQIENAEGHTLFVDQAVLTEDLKKGYIFRIRALLDAHTKLTALEGNFQQPKAANMNFVRYTPCMFCRKDPLSQPLWQLRARNVHWDMEKKDLSYSDATFEVGGVPVMYIPYFSHPDPSVERRSGLLTPTIRGGSFGHVVETPYYIALGTNKDFLLTPAIGTQSQIMNVRYRQRFHNSILSLGGSAGVTHKNRPREKGGMRGHIDTTYAMDINENWRGRVSIKRTSNRSYARLYPIEGLSRASYLTSQVNAEGFYKRTYIHAEAITFQPLLENDNAHSMPLILPSIDVNYQTAPQWANSYWSIDGSVLGLSRSRGESVHRIHALTQWNLPYQSRLGDEYKLILGVRTDGYVYRPDNAATDVKTSPVMNRRNLTRAVPHAALHWKLPLLTHGFSKPLIITPMISVIEKPKKNWNNKFPNDDSRIREVTDINHHHTNRFGGIDKVDLGSRVNYGIKWALYNAGLRPTTIYLGQSYSFAYPNDSERPIGASKRRTDYVTRMYTNPHEYVDAYYRGRFTQDKFAVRRHEFTAGVGPSMLKLHTTLIFIRKDRNPTDEHGQHQITSSVSSQFLKHWSSEVGFTRNLSNPKFILKRFARVAYENECLKMEFSIQRDNFSGTIYTSSGTSYMVRLHLLTFGNTHAFKG
ncbi:MAG: LPS-assembly protein LptD [Alphaproteobacteria bacterium]|nr:MAG: LPS-assembly protein LptD [Alphaproteobacteria bacterium]